MISCARMQGVPEAAVKTWAKDNQLYLEDGVIEHCVKTLSSLDEIKNWWFDPAFLVSAD